jgi:hypothetical protein
MYAQNLLVVNNNDEILKTNRKLSKKLRSIIESNNKYKLKVQYFNQYRLELCTFATYNYRVSHHRHACKCIKKFHIEYTGYHNYHNAVRPCGPFRFQYNNPQVSLMGALGSFILLDSIIMAFGSRQLTVPRACCINLFLS